MHYILKGLLEWQAVLDPDQTALFAYDSLSAPLMFEL